CGRIDFPSFLAIRLNFREILDRKTTTFISFHASFIGFSGSTNYVPRAGDIVLPFFPTRYPLPQ
ncbi:MAG: hypothetical protein WAM85_03300, partial [Terracidiphilus sp.]